MGNHVAYICVGSNMGNKAGNCQKGIDALTVNGSSTLIDQSRFYQTEPVDYEDQDWFVNVVAKIETTLEPFSLLEKLKLIEQSAGRKTGGVRFGPRVLDMDIIFYDDAIVESDNLEIPHPRMHQRRFVLCPICEIEPGIIHPVLKKDANYLLNNLNNEGQKVIPYLCDF